MAVDSSLGSSDHSSMSSSSRGYDGSLFVDDPPQSLQCPVCHLILRDPHLLSCCGAHICEVCITPYKSSYQSCPSCHDEDYATLLNKQLKRRVSQLRVKCSNEGCQWTNQLCNLDNHLEKCEYTLKSCIHGCGECLPQKHLIEHEQHDCIKRPIGLQMNSLKMQFAEKLHVMEEKYDKEIQRLNKELIEQNKRHVEEIENMRMEIQKQQQQQQQQTKKLTMNQTSAQAPPTSSQQAIILPDWCYPLPVSTHVHPPCLFIMPNYSKHKKKDDHWFSQPFYTHPNGYKLCLRVNANGDGNGKGLFISLFVYVMKGEYDECLSWPFYGELTLELLNWNEDKAHIEKTLPFDKSVPVEYNGRQLKYSRGKGWGYQKYTAIDKLPHNQSTNTQFLKDDRLCFRVLKATIHQR